MAGLRAWKVSCGRGQGLEGELRAGGREMGRGANHSDDYRAVNWHAKTFLNICFNLFEM